MSTTLTATLSTIASPPTLPPPPPAYMPEKITDDEFLGGVVLDALGEESVDDFPHYGTVTQLGLSPVMVNALAHLTCWCVASDSKAQMVQAMFDPAS